MRRSITALLLMISLAFISSTAGAALDAEAVGLGENFSTLDGESSYYSNPAGLALRSSDFAVKANFGFSAWNNIFVNDEFTEDELESKLSGEELIVAGRTAAGTQIYYKNFAVAVNAKAEGMLETDSDASELLTADEPKITFEDGEVNVDTVTADFDVTRGGAAAVSDFSLSYAAPIPDDFLSGFNEGRENKIEGIYFGASYHYVDGDIYKFAGEGTVTAEQVDNNVQYTVENTEASVLDADQAGLYYQRTDDDSASGNIFDLGMTVKWEDKYTVALSVMNIGEIEADSYVIDGNYYTKLSDTELEEKSITEETVNESISYKLPRIVRLGGRIDSSPNTTYYAEYSQVSYDLADDDNIFALGSEFRKQSFLPIRLGLNYSSLREDIEFSAGLGMNFDNLKVDMGIADIGALFNDAKSVKFGVSSTLRF